MKRGCRTCRSTSTSAPSCRARSSPSCWPTAMALAGGADGMDFVRRILHDAPAKMSADSVLMLEIGNERPHFEHAFRKLEVAWLETSAGDDQVLLVTRDALMRWSRP